MGVVGTAVPGRHSVAVLVLALLIGGLGLTPPAHGSPGADLPAHPTPGPPAACGPPLPTSGVQGSVSIDGGPLSPARLDGLGLRYTYVVQYATLGPGNASVYASGCRVGAGNATVAANGSFSFVPSLPEPSCAVVDNEPLCTSFAGPYGPVALSTAGAPPAGYAAATNGSATTGFTVTLVYQLAGVSIAPGGPTVAVSMGATTEFAALAWAADGSPSDLDVQFAWSENASGWSLGGSASGPSVNLTPGPEPGSATLSVEAGATVDGDELTPVAGTVAVLAVPTEIATAQTNRTSLDSGRSVAFQLTAFGAGGYNYTVAIAPGLGVGTVGAPCLAGPRGAAPVEITCAANVTYPTVGTAQPTATVTNGHSSATWQFPEIVVAPPPELEVRPAVPLGYVGTAIPVVVSAENGSGTPPFQRACLAAPPAPTVCRETPGPAWEFSPAFAEPGNYSAAATAVDADGANASVELVIEVALPLAVGTIVPSGENVTADASVVLSANVTGGFLPLRYWWNGSRTAGPLLEGELAADGPVRVIVAPNASGAYVVSLTVVDRLGTVVASTIDLAVGPPAAERVVPVEGPPLDAVTVGDPIPLAWEAFELSGAPDPSFATTVELDLSDGGAPPEAWVNTSGLGPLPALGDGAFGVPASAWVDGALNVTLTLATATTVTVGLSGASLPGPVAPRNVTAEPDLAHVRLFAPAVARDDARDNATLWRIDDRFGNPVPGALVTIELVFGAAQTDAAVRAFSLPGGGSAVWVNYTALTAGAGEVTVVDASGQTLLGPLAVPAVPPRSPPSPALDALAAAVPAGALGSAAFAVVRRRRRAQAVEPAEEELRRFAEGRTRVVELIRASGPVDLAGLEAAWGSPPSHALADWIASLVADGTVRATVGADGHPRFCLARTPGETPRVTIDAEIFDRSLRRRDEELDGPRDEEAG